MTGLNQRIKQKNILKKSSNEVPIQVAVVMDAWFPGGKRRPGVVGGGQVHVRELTQAMTDRFPVEFTLFFPAYPNIIYRTIWTWIAVIRIVQKHRALHFSIIHAHGYNSALAAKIAGSLIHVPVVHTVHGSSLLDRKSKSIMASIERWLLTQIKYSAQITVASTFLKHTNINKDIYIIPNGVRVDEFDAIEETKLDEPAIIWVGRDDPVKGLAILRQAIVKIRKKIPTVKAKLVTGGALTGKALIRAYKRAHVFVLPSLAEGQPITLLEAWAAKLPVVVTNVGDNALMVKDGVNGYVVEPGNVYQLTNAIMKVLKARTKDKQMGENGYELVKKEFTWEKAAQRTWEVYQKVMSQKMEARS